MTLEAIESKMERSHPNDEEKAASLLPKLDATEYVNYGTSSA